MSWFKVDDGFWRHRKVHKLGRARVTVSAQVACAGLWALAGDWIVDTGSRGFVPSEQIEMWDPALKLAERLVAAGLWEVRVGGYWLPPCDELGRSLWTLERTDYRKKIPDALRLVVLDRDGWACVECGATGDLTLDHIWPWSLGGKETVENLRTLCRSCNSRKGARI